jgi:hypothetical protein
VITDWTIRLNADTLAIGLVSSRTAFLEFEVWIKSAMSVSFFLFFLSSCLGAL